MYEVRLWLSKQGKIKYVSHLDMFRMLQRAVRRADIPLWYTEGFNPHPYISFLLALPLGVECLRDPVDIRIDDALSKEQLRERLSAVMPEGLRIEDVTTPFCKPSEIACGEYECIFDKVDISVSELEKALASSELTCEKTGKVNGRKTVKKIDVSQLIKAYDVSENDEFTILNCVLPAGNNSNLNPVQLIQAVSGYIGKTVTPLNIVRKKLLCSDMIDFS